MLEIDRFEKILDELEKKGRLSYQELDSIMKVSASTIRRDIEKMYKNGLLIKIKGGVAQLEKLNFDPKIADRFNRNVEGKKEIAQKAFKRIKKGDFIYLDAGTSTYEMIDYLRDRKITVVTNSTYHLPRLINNKIHTIILGGTLKHSTQAVIGHTAIEQLKNYSFDMCFVGCNGIDENFGITTADENEAFIKTAAIKNSKKKYILADKSKFDHRKFHKFADLEEVTIVSYDAPENYEKYANILIVKDKEEA